MSEYILLLLMPVLVCTGQLLLKKYSGSIVSSRGLLLFIKSLFTPGIIAGGLAVACAPLLYIRALGTVDLSEAFAFNSLNYILVFISGRLILKEEAGPYQVIGVILITMGFILPFAAGVISGG
jgi:uncharacterized membrane protein